MQLLSYFLRKYRFFLFFLFLESLALYLIIQNHSFHKSKFVSSANSFTGGLYDKASNVSNYFSLKEENNSLIEENLVLIQKLEKLKSLQITDSLFDSLDVNQRFVFKTSRIIKNSYTSNYNFLLVDTGIKDSLKPEMAVVNSKGIIGVTEKVSQNFTRVQSILNMDTKINAKLKNSSYFGTLTWDGNHYNKVQLIDIERQAPVNIGDTVVTGGRSAIFPKGILIGKVINKNQKTTTTSIIEIELFNDMSNLNSVYIIKNKHQEEIKQLDIINE